MDTILKPGDIFLTRGSSFISRAIRFFTRTIGERRTKVNHVGIVFSEGTLQVCIVIEALSRVRKHKLWKQYGPPKTDSVAVFRPVNLSQPEIEIIAKESIEQVGKKYGYIKIIAHLLDWLLLGAYVFRRIARNGNYPICSWLVAHSFAKAGKNFGVAPGAADPDHIWDFIEQNPDKYKEVYPLNPIWTGSM